MQRLRLYDFRLSRAPEAIGLCLTDQSRIARMVNSAQQRLLFARETGDEGWYGTYAEMVFTVSQTNPYLTLPRGVARLIKANVCQNPVEIRNRFFEYLAFGDGNLPKRCGYSYGCGLVTAYSRNNVVTFTDLTSAPQYIRIYSSDTTGVDVTKRVLIQGTDSSGATIYSTDNGYQVEGKFTTIASPFANVTDSGSSVAFNTITGIQKDVTAGTIEIMQVDPTTGAEVSLVVMEPSETTASYRRYYLNQLPVDCCDSTTTTVYVDAIAKLDLIPVVADTDYLLIQNIESLIHECQSIRYGEIDNVEAKKMADYHHREAIRLLQGQSIHYDGKEKPAMSFRPFGSFCPANNGIGMI